MQHFHYPGLWDQGTLSYKTFRSSQIVEGGHLMILVISNQLKKSEKKSVYLNYGGTWLHPCKVPQCVRNELFFLHTQSIHEAATYRHIPGGVLRLPMS